MSLRRSLRLGSIAVRHLLGHWLGRSPEGPQRLRLALEEAGGTFIKLGQILALQTDSLPAAYCNALYGLMDQVTPVAWPDVETVLRQELGTSGLAAFDRIDRVPIAAASIGQVHRARRGENELAIKVQRPRIDETFGADLRWLLTAAGRLRRWAPRRYHWLGDMLEEFVEWTQDELDYRIEARSMHELARRTADRATTRVPRVDWDLTTPRVLTAEFLDGVPLVDHLRDLERSTTEPDSAVSRRLAQLGFDPTRFATAIVENFLTDVFRQGIYHADLHPANLLILRDNVVGYVDFGITGVLSRPSRRGLVQMTWAYTRGDLRSMVDHFLSLADHAPATKAALFRSAIESHRDDWFDLTPQGVRLRQSFTQVALEMTRQSHRTGIWPHQEILKYLRSVIAVDGLIGRFVPGFDLGGLIGTHCRRVVSRSQIEEAVAFDRLLDQALAFTRLLADGPRRLELALQRPPAPAPGPRSAAARARLGAGTRTGLAGLLFASLAYLLPSASLGPNPTTALSLLAVAALVLSLRSLGRSSLERSPGRTEDLR